MWFQPRPFLIVSIPVLLYAVSCRPVSSSKSNEVSRPCAMPSSPSEKQQLIEDPAPTSDSVKAGALAVGNDMINTLCDEIKDTSGNAVAAAVAEGATAEMTATVGSLVIAAGLEDTEIPSAPAVVAAPVLRGALLGLMDSRTASTAVQRRLNLVKRIISGTSSSLRSLTSELTTEETLDVMGGMAKAAITTLPEISLVNGNAKASVGVVTTASVGALSRAGIQVEAVGEGAQKLTEGVVSALSTPGYDPDSLGALTGEAAGSAIQGLGAAGLSADKIIANGAIESIISGAVSGLKKNESGSASAADAMGSIAGAAVSVLGSVGLSTPEMKKGALSAVIKSSMSGAQSLAKDGDDSVAKAMSAVASQAVLALTSGGFKSDQIGTAVSTIVEAGVSEISKTGITNASLATDIAAKLIEGALFGAGSLIKSGAIDAQSGTDAAIAASNGAVKGLESLQTAGIVTGDSVSTFTNSITSSVSSGLERGGASASVAASAQTSVSNNMASPEVQGQIQANAGAATPVVTPTLSVASGSYSTVQSVTISSTTPGASFRYTLDDSTPTSSSGTVYTGAISISSSKTLKAVGYKSGWAASAVASATYLVNLPAFANPQSFSCGTSPEGVAAGDLNSDGKIDLAVALYSGKGTGFLLGNGDGTFGTHQTVANSPNSLGTFSNISSATIAVDDLNGDSKPDIVWGAWGDNMLSLLTNTTTANAGSLSFAGNMPTGYNPGVSGPRAVAIADIDGDGLKDIALGESNGNKLLVYLNQSGTPGTFAKFGTSFLWNPDSTIFNGNGHPWTIATADFNADGKPDVIMGGGFGGITSVQLNNSTSGSPNFQVANRYNNNTSQACTDNAGLTVNDFNGDGKPDVAFTCTRSGDDKVLIFTNTTGMGATAAAFSITNFDTSDGLIALASGDVDGDGSIDIVTINTSSPETLNLYRGHGDGTFAAAEPILLSAGTGPTRIILVDVNADGRLDAVVTLGAGNQVAILLNQL